MTFHKKLYRKYFGAEKVFTTLIIVIVGLALLGHLDTIAPDPHIPFSIMSSSCPNR